jgi:hypothetical protein
MNSKGKITRYLAWALAVVFLLGFAAMIFNAVVLEGQGVSDDAADPLSPDFVTPTPIVIDMTHFLEYYRKPSKVGDPVVQMDGSHRVDIVAEMPSKDNGNRLVLRAGMTPNDHRFCVHGDEGRIYLQELERGSDQYKAWAPRDDILLFHPACAYEMLTIMQNAFRDLQRDYAQMATDMQLMLTEYFRQQEHQIILEEDIKRIKALHVIHSEATDMHVATPTPFKE